MNNLGMLVPLLALSIPIVALIMTNWRRVKERELELARQGGGELGEAVVARVAKLEQRIAVLERIATDKRRELSDEIDRLGDR